MLEMSLIEEHAKISDFFQNQIMTRPSLSRIGEKVSFLGAKEINSI